MRPISIPTMVWTILAAAVSPGCGGGDGGGESGTSGSSAAPPNVMEITVEGLQFNAPKQVPGGWITFRFKNASEMTHFALLERLPLGKGIKEQQAEVAPVFQQGLDLINAGKPDEAMEKFSDLPVWFSQVEVLGGPGFVGPGHTAQTTVYLEPGTYLLECYVKTVGIFHSYNPDPDEYGMVHEFAVGSLSKAGEPKADLKITISSDAGIVVEGEPEPGEHTISVYFKNQETHENFVGHDVHLVRLEQGTDLEELAAWMDWRDPAGLEVPAPAEFLGGVNEMPAGKTGYFTVVLEPGNYAWIAEVPHPGDQGMLRTFTVE